jgi:hypothetical protein
MMATAAQGDDCRGRSSWSEIGRAGSRPDPHAGHLCRQRIVVLKQLSVKRIEKRTVRKRAA